MSCREASPTGGASSPYAARSIEPARPAIASRGVGAERSASDRLLLDLLGPVDGAAAQAPLEEVDVLARERRVRRAHERVQIRAAAAEPAEPEQAQQRLPVGGRAEPDVRLQSVRDPEGAERRLERRLPAFERRADDPDLLRGDAGADQQEELFADELEDPARARGLEEPQRTFDRRGVGLRAFREERALQVCECRRGDLVESRAELLDAPVREGREIVHRAAERRERGPAGFVRDRHRHLGAAGERLQQPPLRAGQILEAVCEDGFAAPGIEVVGDALGSVTAKQVAVPQIEAVELAPIRGVERGQLALEVVRVDERADRPSEQRRLQREQIALDPVDVRPVRHDEVRLVGESLQVPAQQERHLPSVGRAGDQVQTQLTHATSGSGRCSRARALRA